jgi:hypothetical protein
VFTSLADAVARRCRVVQRRAKLTGASLAQALVFGWLAKPDAALAALARAAAVAGVPSSPPGLDQRGTEGAALFLAQWGGAALQPLLGADAVLLPRLARLRALALLDATTSALPAALGDWWPGCGGSRPTTTSAALKIQVGYDLLVGALSRLVRTDGRTQERPTAVQTAPLVAGALRVSDLGCCALAGFAQVRAQGAYWLSRLKQGTALLDQAGRRLALGQVLRSATLVDWPGQRGVQQHLRARLLAVRVPPKVAAQRRRHLRAQATKQGRTPPAAARALAAWPLLVTTAPADLRPIQEALVLLRARWPGELCQPQDPVSAMQRHVA